MHTPREASRAVCALLVLCGSAVVGCSATSTSAEPPSTVVLGSDPAGDQAADPAEDRADPPVVSAPEDSAANAANIDTVMMVGDSITAGATPALEAQFGALGLHQEIESKKGKRMAVSSSGNPSGASVTEVMVDAADSDPTAEVWVVALGTNDIGQYSSPDEIAAAVDDVLAEVPDDAALVWVDTYVRGREEQAEEVNSIIRDRVAQRENSVIAPWSASAPADGVLSGDGIHPTTDGSARFAFVVTDTVRAFLGR